MRGHNKRIGHRHHLIFRSADTGDKRRLLYNIAGGIVQFNPVAHLERAHISNHQSGNNIADNGTRSERNNQSDKDRNALKYTRFRAWQIRVNHCNHKRVEQEPDDVEGRHCPIRIETIEFETPRLYLTSQIKHHTYQILHRIPDNNNCKQIGDIVYNIHKDIPNRIPDIT